MQKALESDAQEAKGGGGGGELGRVNLGLKDLRRLRIKRLNLPDKLVMF